MSAELSFEGSVFVFLTPEDPELPKVSGELKRGGTVGVTHRIGEYEEVVVVHRPSEDEDANDGAEIYTAPSEEFEGIGRLPTAVDMSEDKIISLIWSDMPYERGITDRHGKKYTLQVQFIGASVLKEAA
jgi:hypothetical protein